MVRSLELLSIDLIRAEQAGDEVSVTDLRERIERILRDVDQCPTCMGIIRQTVDLKCPTCGTDYS